MRRLWRNLRELLQLYRTYEMGRIYRWYVPSEAKEMLRLMKLYLDKENNA